MTGDVTPSDLPPGLLAEYLENMRAQLGVLSGLADRLTAAGDDRDALVALQREIHKIHGSAGSYGFMEASRLAAGLEATVKDWVTRPSDPDVDRGSLARWFVGRLAEMLGLEVPRAPAAAPRSGAAAFPRVGSPPRPPRAPPPPPPSPPPPPAPASPAREPPRSAPIATPSPPPPRPPRPLRPLRPLRPPRPPPSPTEPSPATRDLPRVVPPAAPSKPAQRPPVPVAPRTVPPPPASPAREPPRSVPAATPPPPRPAASPPRAPAPPPSETGDLPWVVPPASPSKPVQRPPAPPAPAAPPPRPLAAAPPAPAVRPSSEPGPAAPPGDLVTVPEVISVEDDPSLAELLQYGLRAHGYRFVAYRNGREALRELLALDVQGTHPLLLLDVDLPALDGYSMFDALQRERPGVYRVVFTTVHGTEEEQLRGLEAGALDYLVKPISLRVALEKIKRWVGR